MISTLRSLKAKQDESRLLRATLDMWGDVQAQGINPDDVKAFTWRGETPVMRLLGVVKTKSMRRVVTATAATHYNTLRMNDDSLVSIIPVLKPHLR